jgi:hypothetical protein
MDNFESSDLTCVRLSLIFIISYTLVKFNVYCFHSILRHVFIFFN